VIAGLPANCYMSLYLYLLCVSLYPLLKPHAQSIELLRG